MEKKPLRKINSEELEELEAERDRLLRSTFCLWRFVKNGEITYFLSDFKDVKKAYNHLSKGCDALAVTKWLNNKEYFEQDQIYPWSFYMPENWFKRTFNKIKLYLKETIVYRSVGFLKNEQHFRKKLAKEIWKDAI